MMITLPGYTIRETIYENHRIRVYRGHAVPDRTPVIIKALKEEALDPTGISKLIREYEMIRGLEIDGVVKPLRLEQSGVTYALVMEDSGALPLRGLIRKKALEISVFLDIAVQLAEIIGELHQKGIIHQDLKPDNILIHPTSGKVTIIDFNMALTFAAAGEPSTPGQATGTAAYMAPEQTGRMNRTVDYRSDLYSLGIVFYEMLTGKLPFSAADSLQWAYAHLTQRPEPPETVNPALPPMLGALTLKMLAKNSDERYQSARGLREDLEECRRQWRQHREIAPFDLARWDLTGDFRMPKKLFGREIEAELLRDAFKRVCCGERTFLLVGGLAGIGKTALVQETLRPLAGKSGFFISGKFDQLQRNVPYLPFAHAFGELIRRLMTENQENVTAWTKKLLRALKDQGAVIAEVIPEIELLLGPQLPVAHLAPADAQNRFRMVFLDFIQVFSDKSHPLVLFLDDLQWADSASLQLIDYLYHWAGHYLLLVGAYRDNEIAADSPIRLLLEKMAQDENETRLLRLQPFHLSQTSQFIADVLQYPAEHFEALAEELYRKSGGSPFHLGQLLKLIQREKLLTFNPVQCKWDWQLEPIRDLRTGDDLSELLLEKLGKLPPETGCLLEMAACIGNSFQLETLAAIWSGTPSETATLLAPAAMEGLILEDGTGSGAARARYYTFAHDWIQQAAYSRIPADHKRQLHLYIGRLMIRNDARHETDEKILTVMDHINRGLDLLTDLPEKVSLAGFNLAAGRKAKASVAFGPALGYFQAGLELLPENSWQEYYQLAYDLSLECAQCLHMCAAFETAERMFETVLERAATAAEKAEVCGIKMKLQAGDARYPDAVRWGIRALEYLGIKIPDHAGQLKMLKEICRSKWYLRGKRHANLAELPAINDPVQEKARAILVDMASAASIFDPRLGALISLIIGNHTLKYGNGGGTAIGYGGYGIFYVCVRGNYRAGRRFERAALECIGRSTDIASEYASYFVLGLFITPWIRHGMNSIDYLQKAARYSREAGNLLYMGYSLAAIVKNSYLLGFPLPEIAAEIHKCRQFAARAKHEILNQNLIIYQHLVDALRDGAAPSGDDRPDGYGGAHFRSAIIDKLTLMTYYMAEIQVRYLFGDYGGALDLATQTAGDMAKLTGFIISAEAVFYQALAITAQFTALTGIPRLKAAAVLRRNRKKLRQWAVDCPENFRHKDLLVAAETARLRGRREEAMTLYDQAIASARENGYLQNEALANELAGRFYLASDKERIARIYFQDAWQGYQKWGAAAKAKTLEALAPEPAEPAAAEDAPDLAIHGIFKDILQYTSSSDKGAAGELDLMTIRKMLEGLAEETAPERLLASYLEIAAENAGADRGYLLLEKQGNLFIEVVKDSGPAAAAVVTPLPMEKCPSLAKTVVRYVTRTLQPVNLNGGEPNAIFGGDAYLARAGSISVACLPVLLLGVLAGVLYLENTMTSGAFTPGRLETLQLLSTQIASAQTLRTFLEGKAAGGDSAAGLAPGNDLTARETEVLRMLADGMSNREIAEALQLTVSTVKTHILNLYGKLGVTRRVQAAARARELQLLKE